MRCDAKYTSASSTVLCMNEMCLHFQNEEKGPVFGRQTADSRPTVGRKFFEEDILMLQNHLQMYYA